MRRVTDVELYAGTREEKLPGYGPDFPCIASQNVIRPRAGMVTPWHWHRPVELFYMAGGALTYMTPGGERVFPEGSGGLVNANVLHRTRLPAQGGAPEQRLFIFDAQLIAGGEDGRIAQRYVEPVLRSGAEIVPLLPQDGRDAQALALLRDAFSLEEDAPGYELRLRAVLSQVWLRIYEKAAGEGRARHGATRAAGEKLRRMLDYIDAHYAERLTAKDVAAAGYCSEREAYRVFEQALRTTPGDYVRSRRVARACALLAQGRAMSVTDVAQACGFSSGSHFGQIFRAQMGMTPLAYRRLWQDSDKNGQEQGRI